MQHSTTDFHLWLAASQFTQTERIQVSMHQEKPKLTKAFLWCNIHAFPNLVLFYLGLQTITMPSPTAFVAHHSLRKYCNRHKKEAEIVYSLPSHLQSAVQEATVLPRLIAETFTGCYRSCTSWSKHPLDVPSAHRKVTSFPRHLPALAAEQVGFGWQSISLDRISPFFHQNSKPEQHPTFCTL